MSEKKNGGSKKSTLVLIGILVLVIAGAALLYPRLTKEMEEQTVPAATEAPAAAESEKQAETAQKPAEAAGPVQKFFAPDFTVYDREGNPKKLSEFRGKPVVVNFFASWCGPCRIEMPYFEEAYKAHGDQVEFMMVNLNGFGNDKKERAEAMVEEGGYTFPVYFDTDGNAAMAYPSRAIPVTLFISAEGELKGQKIGAMRQEDLNATVDAMIAEMAE